MKPYILAACLAAFPFAVHADEASELLEKLKPVCAKPIVQLTVAQIEECRTQLRMLTHFVGVAHEAADAVNRNRGIRVERPTE